MSDATETSATQLSLFSHEALAGLSRAVHGWEEGPLAKAVQRSPERAAEFSTSSHEVGRLYTWLARLATVVPQDPAPRTATRRRTAQAPSTSRYSARIASISSSRLSNVQLEVSMGGNTTASMVA